MRSKMVSRRDNLGERKRLGKSGKMMHFILYINPLTIRRIEATVQSTYLSHSIFLGWRLNIIACYCGEVWRLGIANRHVWPPKGTWGNDVWVQTLPLSYTTSYHFIWYHVDNLLSSMSNKDFRKLHDIQLWRWAIKLPNYDRREAAKQHKPMILDHFATPVVWLSLSQSYGDETLNPWSVKIHQKPGILSVGSKKKYIIVIDPTKFEALTMPSSNPWLRPCWKGRQNSVERDTKRMSLWVAKAPLVPF